MRAHPSSVQQATIQRMVEDGIPVDQIAIAVQVELDNLKKYIKSFGWKASKKEKADASPNG